jgi:uncharacterized membrane protein YphA (DoxX/SURF4 family)
MSKQRISKVLNISLWLAQVLLSAMFLASGTMKLMQSIEQLASSLPWVRDVSVNLVRFNRGL